MRLQTTLCDTLDIDFPMVMAPMFLVSNTAMMKAGMDAGIAAAFPSLNFRNEGELEKVLSELNAYKDSLEVKGTYGVNLIVQKTNPLYKKHLTVCVAQKVPFYITSLGSPKEVIEKAHTYGAKVFCDVTNMVHAEKCYQLGCDGFVAVGQGAGGHAGPNPLQTLVPALRKHFPGKLVMAAGGIASGDGIASVLALGADGAYIGTRFIASSEASVNEAYKKAIVEHGQDDIVMTTKISGTPCTIINTPYAKKIGYKQNWVERLLSNNATTKKWFKMLVQLRGMKKLEQSVKPANYKTLWCAGKSVELVDEILPIAEIVARLKKDTFSSIDQLSKKVD